MTWALVAAGWLGAVPSAASHAPVGLSAVGASSQEVVPGQVAAVELLGPGRPIWLGERFELELAIELDQGFFDRSSVPLLRRPLDFQVAVGADWLPGVDGRIEALAQPLDAAGGPTVAVGDAVWPTRRAAPTTDGRTRLLLRLPFTATGPGALELTGPVLRFAYATEFGEGFLGGREPRNRREAFVTSEPLTLNLRALPGEGRPFEFDGAVGSLSATAAADRRDLELGSTLELRLTLAGDAAGQLVRAPEYPATPDVRALGSRRESDGAAVTFVYSLEPQRDGAIDLEPPRVAHFDPQLGGYAWATAAAVPIIVRAPAIAAAAPPDSTTGSAPEDGPGAPPDPAVGPDSSAGPENGAGAIEYVPIALAVLAAVGGGLSLWRRVRRPGGGRPTAVEPEAFGRLRAAARQLDARMAVEGADPGELLVEALARALDCAPAAVVDRDLTARLERAGFEPAASRSTAELAEALVGARFGGEPPGDAGRRSLEAVARLLDPS